jgi:hypothetical protein
MRRRDWGGSVGGEWLAVGIETRHGGFGGADCQRRSREGWGDEEVKGNEELAWMAKRVGEQGRKGRKKG